MKVFTKNDQENSMDNLLEKVRKLNNEKLVYLEFSGANSTFFISLFDVLKYIERVYGLKNIVCEESWQQIDFKRENTCLVKVYSIDRKMLEYLLAQK